MTRKIKFRAWDKIDKKMKNVDHIEFLDPEFYDYDCVVGFNIMKRTASTPDYPPETIQDILWRNSPDCEIMQSTGREDKNNKEIYEGDILKGLFRCPELVYVKWDYYQWSFCDPKTNRYYNDITHWDLGSGIVGNIYENPELIELSIK